MSARGGRGQQPKETIGNACDIPSAEQHKQQPSKQQRDKDRSLLRLHEFQQATACGARWAPLVRKLLRKERAISRHAVCTAHWRHRIALRNKMGDFVSRAMHLLSNKQPNTLVAIGDSSVAIGDSSAQRRGGALAAGLLRRLFCRYGSRRHYAAAMAVMHICTSCSSTTSESTTWR